MGKEERTKFAFQAHFSTFRGGSGTNLNLKIDYRVTISSYVNLPGSNTFKVCLLIIFFVACVACGFECAWMSGKVWRRMELNACFAASNSPPPPPPPPPFPPPNKLLARQGMIFAFNVVECWKIIRHQAYILADVLLGILSKGIFERLRSTGSALTQKMYLFGFFTLVETI